MQLGTRWGFGATPPARLTVSMTNAIAAVEAGRSDGADDPARWSWTLTWLEGHPIAELDDGTVVREGYDGSITVTQEDDRPED
jgi:hypothetical protein